MSGSSGRTVWRLLPILLIIAALFSLWLSTSRDELRLNRTCVVGNLPNSWSPQWAFEMVLSQVRDQGIWALAATARVYQGGYAIHIQFPNHATATACRASLHRNPMHASPVYSQDGYGWESWLQWR